MSVLERALRIDAGERRATAFVVALMFGSMAGIAIGDSSIQAMFLARFGTGSLPQMYLAQAAVTLLVMFGLTATLDRVDHRLVYIASPALLAVMLLVERAIVVTDVGWIYPVLWVTVAFAMLAQAIGLWGIAGAVIDTRQAKRLFPIFAAGGILGSVVGGLATTPLAKALGAPNLLFVWAGLLVGASLLCRLTLGAPRGVQRHRRRHSSPLQDMREGFTLIRRSGLLVAMAIAAVLFSVLFYSLYLPFATAAADKYPDPSALAGFLGIVWAVVTGTAFLLSLVVTNRLFVWFGVAVMILVLPILYAGAFTTLLITSAFAAIVALRITTGIWLQGVASPAWEALVNSVPEERRDQTRAFLNGGPAQVGTAIAGIVAIVGRDVLTSRQFAAIGLVAAVATLLVASRIRRAYAGALVEAMLEGRPQVFDKRAPWTPMALGHDAESAKALVRSMHAEDVAERRLAFQLASVGSVPPQESLRGAVDPDPVVRLAAARAIDVTEQHGRAAIRVLTDDTDPAVAAAAAARTLAVEDSEEARDRLDLLLADRSPRVRRAALEQLRLAPSEIAADLAAGLLEDPAPEVRTAALTAMRGVPDRALEPAVAALDDPDPWVRAEAGRVLGALGPAAVGSVLAALDRPKTMAAGVEAARLLRAGDRSDLVDDFVVACGERIGRDVTLAGSIPNGDEARDFLRAAVLERAQRVARSALWAATTVARQPDAMAVAIEHLDADASRVPAALETLETASGRTAVRPLLAPWETIPTHTAPDWLAHALADDATIHRCAAFIRDMQGGDTMVRSATGTAIERALLLRHVPLFAELNPTDLELVAEVAEERGYADAETIALQGEIGDEIHIITEGTIRVMQAHEGEERELATRAEGDVVGEMSLLTRTPRVATLVADGSVRTLTIGYRQFESILRERPTVSLGLLRVLASRLSDAADAPERTA